MQCGKSGNVLVERLARRVAFVHGDHADNELIGGQLQLLAAGRFVKRFVNVRINGAWDVVAVRAVVQDFIASVLAHANSVICQFRIIQDNGRDVVMINGEPRRPFRAKQFIGFHHLQVNDRYKKVRAETGCVSVHDVHRVWMVTVAKDVDTVPTHDRPLMSIVADDRRWVSCFDQSGGDESHLLTVSGRCKWTVGGERYFQFMRFLHAGGVVTPRPSVLLFSVTIRDSDLRNVNGRAVVRFLDGKVTTFCQVCRRA